MSSGPSGSTVLDTSVLIELAVDSSESRETRDGILAGRIQPMVGELNVAELSYVLCRKAGAEQAARAVGHLRKASQFRIVPPSSFLDRAAEMKCARSISMLDCVTIAMGESLGVPVLFAKRERELSLEMKKSPFRTELLFLDER